MGQVATKWEWSNRRQEDMAILSSPLPTTFYPLFSFSYSLCLTVVIFKENLGEGFVLHRLGLENAFWPCG